MTAEVNTHSIEEIIKDYYSTEICNMDQETTKILVTLLKSSKDYKLPEKDKPFLMRLIEKRIQHCFSYNTNDDRVTFFLSIACQDAGNSITTLWYIQYWCSKNSVKEIDLELLCTRILPWGIPGKDHMKELWLRQKMENEKNLFDIAEAGKSILQITEI